MEQLHICLVDGLERVGRRRACRLCKKTYAKKYRSQGKNKEADRRYYLKTKTWHLWSAKAAILVEVRSGRMPRPQTLLCVDCGVRAEEYDHRDYLRPLDVVPVCQSCNKRRGPGKNKKPTVSLLK